MCRVWTCIRVQTKSMKSSLMLNMLASNELQEFSHHTYVQQQTYAPYMNLHRLRAPML